MESEVHGSHCPGEQSCATHCPVQVGKRGRPCHRCRAHLALPLSPSLASESQSLCEDPPSGPEAQPPQDSGAVTWKGQLSGPSPGTSSACPLPAPPGARLEPGAVQRKPYMCKQCGRSFDWKSVFVIHHRSHTGEQSTEKLPQAPRESPTPHLPRRTLTGPRSYACEECGCSFSWKSQLVIHRKNHASQRRHLCGDCGRGFDWKSQLVIHRKSHQQEVP